jgi:hypothetical protein
MILIDTIRSNSYLIIFILGIVFAYLMYKTWNDRHAVGVGNKITEKVKDLLLDYNCKIDSSGNVKCKGEFANLGKYFSVSSAVDAIVKNFLRELSVGANEPLPPQQSQQSQQSPSVVYDEPRGMPPPASSAPQQSFSTTQPSLVGMGGMGGLQPADFQGGGGASGQQLGMMQSSAPSGRDANLPFEPIKTRTKDSNNYQNMSKSGSYDPNHY